MSDTLLITSDLQFATIILNAVLLTAMGLAIALSKWKGRNGHDRF
jgi:hypothetical protein